MTKCVGRTLVFVVVILCFASSITSVAVAHPDNTQNAVEHTTGPDYEQQGFTATGFETQPDVFQDNESSDENETKRHENPADSEEDGNLEQVESWLVGRLTGQLAESAIQLSEGEYELAREFIGEEYRNRFGQYVDVAGETEGDSNAAVFNETRETQTQLADSLQTYQETKEEYEAALEAGETNRARELARELNSQATEIEALTEELQERYEDLDELTDEDLTEVIERITDINEETQSEIAEIRSTEFVETNLGVETDQETISYLDPLSATGQLSTVDGEPIGNETIQIRIAGETRQVETDGAGVFDFQYRPTTLPLSTTAITIQYIPDNDSVYLESNASIGVTVEQVEPRIVTLDVPDTIAYAETAVVNGTVLVDETSVDGVPIEISVGSQQLATATVENGSFNETFAFPASVPEGEQELVVRIPGENRAIANVSATQTVTVEATDTSLAVNATQAGDSTVQVTGALETVGGIDVSDEPVQITVDGTTVTTVTTTTDGEFVTEVSTPDVENEPMQVSVAYLGSGSNLNPTEANTTVELESLGPNESANANGDSNQGTDSVVGTVETVLNENSTPSWVWLSVVLGGVIVFGALVGVLNYISAGPLANTPILGAFIRPVQQVFRESSDSPSQTDAQTASTDGEQTEEEPTENLLRHATEQLQSGHPDVAIQSCYSAVRENIGSRLNIQGAPTHWEFYQQYRNAESDVSPDKAEVNILRELTEQYERATFSPNDVSSDTAERILEQARKLCGIDRLDSNPPADD